jgi:hypothetical protein
MKLLLKILMIILALSLPGCRWFTSAGTPFLSGMTPKIPDGTPAFQQGFKDGCSSILYARGTGVYRAIHDYHFDPKMIGNPEYRFGHSRGQSYCFQNIIGPNPMASSDRYLLPHGNAGLDTSPTDYETAWGGFFGGKGGAGKALGDNVFDDSGVEGIFGAWGANTPTGSAIGANPLWAGGSKGQLFGQ